jgi:hypothetical protein
MFRGLFGPNVHQSRRLSGVHLTVNLPIDAAGEQIVIGIDLLAGPGCRAQFRALLRVD